jgi:ATP-binding protein involved in chromosome partitioning
MLSFCRCFSQTTEKEVAKKMPFGIKALPGISNIVMTASCKGGVGKSTVALNTAVALQKAGNRVGLLDADIYGPSVPTIAKTQGMSLFSDKDGNFIPIDNYGISTVSVGNAIDPKSAMLWKGPIVGSLISELMRKALWPELDYLILDTPPGTGDVQLAIAQTVPVDGAIVVTQPQDVSVADVVRNFKMFETLKIKPLGIVQNMDGFKCPKCKTVTKILPGEGAKNLADKYKIPLIGSLPIDPEISASGDKGVPALISHPDSEYAQVFKDIAQLIMEKLPKRPPKYPARKRLNE